MILTTVLGGCGDGSEERARAEAYARSVAYREGGVSRLEPERIASGLWRVRVYRKSGKCLAWLIDLDKFRVGLEDEAYRGLALLRC